MNAANGALLAHPQMRAAARLLDGEAYAPLWPVDDEREFNVVQAPNCPAMPHCRLHPYEGRSC